MKGEDGKEVQVLVKIYDDWELAWPVEIVIKDRTLELLRKVASTMDWDTRNVLDLTIEELCDLYLTNDIEKGVIASVRIWLEDHADKYIRTSVVGKKIRDEGYTNPDCLKQMIYDLDEYLKKEYSCEEEKE